MEKDRYREDNNKDKAQLKTMDDTDNAKSQAVSQSKSYISNLEKDLKDERQAREKLQNDIELIKRMNSEISEKLGIKLSK